MTNAGLFSPNFRLAMLSIAMMVLSAVIVLMSARYHNKAEYLARHDPLTGLPTRGLFTEALEAALDRAAADGAEVGLVLIDLDHLKAVNDTMGHPAGDALLMAMAERLRQALPGDAAARIGGDEFAAVLSGRDSRDGIERDAWELLAILRRETLIDGRRLQPTVSLVVAIFPSDAPDRESLVRSADMALYRAKARGRNGVEVFDAEAAAPARRCV